MASSDRQEASYLPRVDGQTGVLGVFGFPVGHSLSPVMHNAAIAALGHHLIYIPFPVRPDDIGPAIRSLIPLGIIGVNLTIPHKESVLPFLDEVTPEALAVGAVNTVHNRGGRLVGHNTDGDGFVAPLGAMGFALEGRRALVLGAGGAARSVVHRLAREGARVTLVNRTAERAERLADEVNRAGDRVCVRWLDSGAATELRDAMGEADLLVNTTSVGMSPRQHETPSIPLDALHANLLVYDLIYAPRETGLLASARRSGARTLNGVKMLASQGAASFEIWTGTAPPVDVMERAVEQQLDAREAGRASA